jgi:transcriptional regulator with XRE-family HTH domain
VTGGDHVTQPGRAQRWTTVLNGTRLRELRRRHGLSQEKLADRAGVSLTTVARLESQPKSPCRCQTLARLAAALGEDPASIVYADSRTDGQDGSRNKDGEH